MKVRVSDNRFILSSGETDRIRIQINETNFDDILSLFFVPKVVENERRPKSIRFESCR